jgi:alpha-beta hydrolase superfamily lysophospholipase
MTYRRKFDDERSPVCLEGYAGTSLIKTQGTQRSTDGATDLLTLTWEPSSVASARGIVQLVHGMTEFVDRYDDFARFLVANGFIVVGHDHLAHGGSVVTSEQWGCLPRHTGADILVADTHLIRQAAQRRFGTELPYILLGHSMGSFVVRAYLMEQGAGLAGAIISGTAQQPRALSWAAVGLSELIATFRGADYRSPFVDSLGVGAYNKPFEPARTSHDWLSRDEAVVDAYEADPRCSFMFSVSGYEALTRLTGRIVSRRNVERAPTDIPLLFIGGACDPVGAQGRGVRAAAAQFRAAGNPHVAVTVYPEARHELLKELNRDEVYVDVLDWIDAVLAGDLPATEDARGSGEEDA